MSIINNSHAIGVDSRNLVLKTRGSLHVKVGDRYYEIDFRNLGAKEDEEKEKHVVSIETKDQIESLEYPGDDKLVVSLDGSLFITKNNTYIDVTPKTTTTTTSALSTTNTSNFTVTDIESATVNGKLFSSYGYYFDFINGEINARTIEVSDSFSMPANTITTRCCKTHKVTDVDDDGVESERIVKNYEDYDFVEIVEVPTLLAFKSGSMIKSSVDAKILVEVAGGTTIEHEFVTGGLYIIYEQSSETVLTKLN